MISVKRFRGRQWLFLLLLTSSGLEAGVIGKWEFNGSLQDTTGKNNGKAVGGTVSYVEDRFGNKDGALFLEKKQSVDFGTGKSLTFADDSTDKPFTIAWWQKPELPEKNGRPESPVSILRKNGEYSIGWSNAFRAWMWDGKWNIGATSNIALNSKTWTHVAVTYDGSKSSSGIRIYQNGKLLPAMAEDSKTHAYAGMKRWPYSGLRLGDDYIGAFDDLVICDHAMTEKEVMNLFNSSPDGTASQKDNPNFKEYNDNRSGQTKASSILIPFIGNPPQSDGDFGAPPWNNAKWHELGYSIGFRKKNIPTKFTAFHDRENIYIGIVCNEPLPEKIKCVHTEHDSDVWLDDSVEIFINTGFSAHSHYHIAFNTRGVVFDQLSASNNTNSQVAWESGAKVNVKVGKNTWTGMIVIPLASMRFAENNPDYWKLNMIRTRKTDPPKGSEREISSFSPVRNGHDSKNFRFARIERLPLEFAAVDAVLEKVAVISEDGDILALCDFSFNNASSTSKRYEFSAGIRGDASEKGKIILTLPPGVSKKRIPLKVSESGKAVLGFHLNDADTGKSLLLGQNNIDLTYVPLSVTLLQPHYKQAIFSNQRLDELVFKIEASLGEKDRTSCKIKFELKNSAGKTILAKDEDIDEKFTNRLTVPVPGLTDGNYTMLLKLIHKKTDRVLGTWENYLLKLPYRRGQVNITENALLLVDDKPFVPFGLVSMGSECSLVWEASEFGCNTIHSLLKVADENLPFLDAVDRKNLKIIVYGLPDSIEVPCFNNKKGVSDRPLTSGERKALSNYINKYKNRTAILSWYTGNEPGIPRVSPEIMRDIEDVIGRQDPYHPTMVILNFQFSIFTRYSDVCGVDPYPVVLKNTGWKSLNLPAVVVADSIRLSSARKPVWSMGESVFWKDYGGLYGDNDKLDYRCPDLNDLRSQFFQSLISGATGFFWYSRPWLRPSVEIYLKYLFKETELLQSVIVTPQSKKMFETLEANRNDGEHSLHMSRRDLGSHHYLFTANGLNQSVKHTFKTDLKVRKLHVAGESRTLTVSNGIFSDSFAPLGTHLYTTDEDMAQHLDREMRHTLKLIDECNNPKTKPGNLACVEKGTRIEAETPILIRNGVKWVPAWEHMIDSNRFSWSTPNFTSISAPGGKNKLPEWIQLTFSSPVEFSQVIIDSNINEVAIQIRRNGKWETVCESRATDKSYRQTQIIRFSLVTAKELRLVAKSANGFAGLPETRLMVWEIEVYK